MSYGYEISPGTPYAYGLPALIDGVWAYVVSAPEPKLTISGYTGTITAVRFIWTLLRCGACRQQLHLYTDGGTIEVGLTVAHTGGREPALTADWFQTYRPAGIPGLPGVCPHPDCPSHTRQPVRERVHLEGNWSLTAGPFHLGDTPGTPAQPMPAGPQTTRLVSRVWDTVRANYPDLAALADTREAARIRRAAANRASRNRSTSR
jgi:hypothetical protein